MQELKVIELQEPLLETEVIWCTKATGHGFSIDSVGLDVVSLAFHLGQPLGYVHRRAYCSLILTATGYLEVGYGSVCRKKVRLSLCHVAQATGASRNLHVENRKGDG
jgi:hypothetical protein